jgi:pimeloyl-ACP methyl ester carboxylesterase
VCPAVPQLSRLASSWLPKVIVIALALTCAGVCAAPAAADSINWTPCKEAEKGLECARVQVPLNWSEPAGPKISLAVIRRPASKPAQRIGSLFVNFGGPGVAGVTTVKGSGKSLDQLGDGRFDIVSWDPRGTGESTHISCFSNQAEEAKFWGVPYSVPVTSAEWRKRMPQAVAFAKRCTKRSRSLLRYDSTADTARDLDHLRELLGEPKMNYRGLSYGTFIGQTYANLFPDRVRAMVLDANLNPFEYTKSVVKSIVASNSDTDLVVRKFLQLCGEAGPKRCALARGGGSPQGRFNRLVAALKQDPIPAPKATPPKLTYSDFLIRIFLGQATPSEWPKLADELAEAARGNGSAIAQLAQNAGPLISSSLNSAVGLQCADKPVPPKLGPSDWPQVLGTLTKASVYNGPFLDWLLWAPCSAWTVPAVHRYTGPWDATTPNPVLVIGTRYDPRTNYQASVTVSKTLGNAVLLTHEGYGHTSEVDPSACVERDVATYLITLATPPKGTVCQSDHLPFSPKFGRPPG